MSKLRSILSALCIVLATLLVPFGVASGWAKSQLLDEDAFVATFAPLASEPAVQQEVVDRVTASIESRLDIDGLTGAAFDSIVELGLSGRAESALRLLQQPAAAGLRSTLHSGVDSFVRSEGFDAAWEASLRASHRSMLALATHDSFARGVLTLDPQGQIELQLGPVVDAVRHSLGESGFGFAALIPPIGASIVIAQSDALPTISLVYALAGSLGWWLPVLALALFAFGVLLARRRWTAVSGSGVGLLLSGLALLLLFGIASMLLQARAPASDGSAQALDAILSQTVAGMRANAWVLAALGLALALLGFFRRRAAVARPTPASAAGDTASTAASASASTNGHDERGHGG